MMRMGWRAPLAIVLFLAVVTAVLGLAPQTATAGPVPAITYPPLTTLQPANPAAPARIIDPTLTRPDPSITWDPVHRDYVMYTSSTIYATVPMWTAPSVTGPWTWAGNALPTLPPWVVRGEPDVWKPSVAYIDGAWTLWGSAVMGGSNSLCLYRATGPGPLGPFTVDTDPAVSPANFCPVAVGGDIDPKATQARDGTWWLSWKYNANVTGQETSLLSVRLGPNGEPTGPVSTLVNANQPWEVGMVESPSFVQDEATGTWWLTLSGGDFGTPNSYQIAAIPCASLGGPCYDAYTVHLISTNSQGVGPGEQSAFTEPDGAMWILYNPSGPFVDPGLRPLAVVRLGFSMDGLPYVGDPNQNYTPSIPAPVTAVASTPGGLGYWLADAQGFVTAHGAAVSHGDMAFSGLNAPIVSMTATPDGRGYWLLGADGGVFTFGDAGYYGSTGGLTLAEPVVGMTATHDGKGYWLVAADGGVFAFGDAGFAGSMGGKPLAAPVVGIAPDVASGGYWLVAADGGVFAFDAPFLGSTGAQRLNAPVNSIIGTTSGHGYMFVAADGGVFNYGDAAFHGSTGGMVLNAPIAGADLDRATGGYWLAGVDGGIFAFDAPFEGAG
jgi:hypothetical protein